MRIWLKQIRERNKMTHEQVAKKSGISRSFYTHIENGTKDPGVTVAKALGNSLDFNWTLFFESECHLKGHFDSRHKGVI
ncbi:helix-turn-helix transcriptional regulator [Halalkalibacter sp. AB-rgal2]|uniref:helix-turn-helix transcriptional regulator n=1 Tax=Halalkalibacter sp. AB-rgal2 TaxID=3242695 RepID=UPI00359D8E01